MPWYFANLVCTLFLHWKKPLRPSNLFITVNHWQWIHVECPWYWSTSKQLKWRTHSQEYRQVFTVGLVFFWSFQHNKCSEIDQRRQLFISLPRGGRDGCTSPSWNAPLPSLSVSVSPIHAGLYPALLYVSSYAHAPVLSLSLWHVSLKQTEINFRVLPVTTFSAPVFHKAKLKRGWNWWEPSAMISVVFLKGKSCAERGLESPKSVRSCTDTCIEVKNGC